MASHGNNPILFTVIVELCPFRSVKERVAPHFPAVPGVSTFRLGAQQNFGWGINALMLVEEGASFAHKLPVVGLPSCAQRGWLSSNRLPVNSIF